MTNDKDQHDRGLKLRTEMFGREAVEKRMNAFGEFGKPLQHIINAYAYGDVWSRSALPLPTKSLVMVAMMAAAGHDKELGVHIRGALKNGCSARANPGGASSSGALLRDSGRQRSAPDRDRDITRAHALVRQARVALCPARLIFMPSHHRKTGRAS